MLPSLEQLVERVAAALTPDRPRRFPRAAPFHTSAFPPEREVVLDALTLGATKHMIHGLIEADVTEARRRLRALPGAASFTCYVLACVGRAAAERPEVHAYRDPNGTLYRFQRVDVNTIVEVHARGRAIPVAHVVRACDQRDVVDLTDEIRAVQGRSLDHPAAERPGWIRAFARMPPGLRRPLYQWVLAHPAWLQQIAGTLTVTAVGMFGGHAGGFAIGPPSVHNLQIVVGGIRRESERELLQLTLSFNHDVIDGAPAARFAARFRELLESAEILAEVGAETQTASTRAASS